MGKRGKYRQYNEPKRNAVRSGLMRSDEKIGQGQIMYRRVHDEKFKHYIGEKRTLNRVSEYPEKDKTIEGVVIGLYPYFILLDCGEYNTTISYKDLILGGRRDESKENAASRI